MSDIRIIKNEEVTSELLDKVVKFDQSIFSVDDGYSFPDGYLASVYENHPEGMFVLLDNEKVIGYVNVLFMSDERFGEYLVTRDYLKLKNEGLMLGENNMYFYTLALDPEYRDMGYVNVLLKSLFGWLKSEAINGKTLKNAICEVIFEDGIKPALKMGLIPMEGESVLGMYYSKDCFKEYMDNLLSDNHVKLDNSKSF